MTKKVQVEILSWLITFLLVVLILLPVYQGYGNKYPFYTFNILFIILFITLSRYIFLLRHAPFSHNKWVKGILFFACIPLLLFMTEGLYDFQRFLDEIGLQELSENPISASASNIAKYTRYQYIFFASGTLITLVLFPLRMVISVWRQYKKGTV